MKTMPHLASIFYIAVLLICLFSIGKAAISLRRGGSKTAAVLSVQIMTAFCAMAVNTYYLIIWKSIPGDYVIYMAFVLSPVFIVKFSFGRGRAGIMSAAAVLAVTAAGLLVSCLHPLRADVGAAVAPLLTAVLIALTWMCIRRVGLNTRKFDGTVQAKEVLEDFHAVLCFLTLLLPAYLGSLLGNVEDPRRTALSLVCMLLTLGLAYAVRRSERARNGTCGWKAANPVQTGEASPDRAGSMPARPPVNSENLFTRVCEYFEREKPFLNPDLTLSDVAKTLLTNTAYISRSVNECTGKNFCQFVNYYRVKHAVELFRGNTSYKIADLSFRSGFRTVHSFTLAFRMNMNVSPSYWCRMNSGKGKRTGRL